MVADLFGTGRKQDSADSVNVFNDSPVGGPIEELMPVEQMPIEINLREPRRRGRDFFTLLWLLGWGIATAVALSALAVTSQTQTASERLRSIFAFGEPTAVAQMPPRITHLESETQILSEQIRTLKSDRDRLAGRIALLESSIDDITGTIKRQAAATAAALAAVKTEAPSRAISASTSPAPVSPSAGNPSAPAPERQAAGTTSETKADQVTTSSVPLPPGRAAASQADSETPMGNSGEFGLDLGGAATLDGVWQRWTAVKANFGPLLSGMRPLAAAERRQGKAGYRLVVGPLPNGPAATGLCAHFSATHTACKAVKFEGEQITQR